MSKNKAQKIYREKTCSPHLRLHRAVEGKRQIDIYNNILNVEVKGMSRDVLEEKKGVLLMGGDEN